METIGQHISERRKVMGLTQEELAEQAQLSLRTIQRIENNESEPRGRTLSLLCAVLQLNLKDIQQRAFPEENESKVKWAKRMLDGFFLLLFNITLMSVFGYLILDTHANLHSKVGAYLLAIFIPLTIIAKTSEMEALRRLLYFGSGLFVYCILFIVIQGIPKSIVSGLLPCLCLAMVTLYVGDIFYQKARQ